MSRDRVLDLFLLYNVRQVGHQPTECLLQHYWDVHKKIRNSATIDTVLVTTVPRGFKLTNDCIQINVQIETFKMEN
jgi:hypothetical protein